MDYRQACLDGFELVAAVRILSAVTLRDAHYHDAHDCKHTLSPKLRRKKVVKIQCCFPQGVSEMFYFLLLLHCGTSIFLLYDVGFVGITHGQSSFLFLSCRSSVRDRRRSFYGAPVLGRKVLPTP